MESFDTTFLDHYLTTVKEKSSHIIECKSGKKKWLFYFVEGQLTHQIQLKNRAKRRG